MLGASITCLIRVTFVSCAFLIDCAAGLDCAALFVCAVCTPFPACIRFASLILAALLRLVVLLSLLAWLATFALTAMGLVLVLLVNLAVASCKNIIRFVAAIVCHPCIVKFARTTCNTLIGEHACDANVACMERVTCKCCRVCVARGLRCFSCQSVWLCEHAAVRLRLPHKPTNVPMYAS